jgi:hypothetical protein
MSKAQLALVCAIASLAAAVVAVLVVLDLARSIL